MPPRKTSPNTPRRNIKPLAAAPSSVESSTMPSISQQGGELSPTNPRKRRASGQQIAAAQPSPIAPAPAPTAPPSFLSDPQFGDAGPFGDATGSFVDPPPPQFGDPPTQAGTTATTATTDQAASGTTAASATPAAPPAKKTRTNTPWTPAEEQRLKAMRDAGNTWSEIAKTFPTRTEGSVKKHWYKVRSTRNTHDSSRAPCGKAHGWRILVRSKGESGRGIVTAKTTAVILFRFLNVFMCACRTCIMPNSPKTKALHCSRQLRNMKQTSGRLSDRRLTSRQR